MTFLVLVATFIGCSCVLVPLLILGVFALFDRDRRAPLAGTGRAANGSERGG